MSTYILLSNFMKINQDIISTYVLISNVMKINQVLAFNKKVLYIYIKKKSKFIRYE
jgi:hypothetical protein